MSLVPAGKVSHENATEAALESRGDRDDASGPREVTKLGRKPLREVISLKVLIPCSSSVR